MSLTSEPFYCCSCCQRKHAAAIEELTAAVTSLQNEVSELRSDARRAEDPSSMFVQSHDLSAAVRCVNSHRAGGSRGRGGGGRRGRGGGGRRGGRNGDGKTGGSSGGYGIGRRSGMGNGSGDGGSQGAEDVNGDRPSGLAKVKVVGALRVWGTMSMCTTSTVQNVISLWPKLSTCEGKN